MEVYMYKKGLTIWYNVKDIHITRKFYEELLGFEVLMFNEAEGMAIMKTPTPDTEIGFSSATEIQASTASVVFTVENIAESVTTLRERGVQFIGNIETVPGMVKLATFVDPDGNSLMLAESITDGY